MRPLYYTLDADGIPTCCHDTIEWARWFESADRTVHKTVVGASKVSTVFLGLDHQYGNGPPVLWETLVFGGPMEDEIERYISREAAVAGHWAMVERVRQLLA